MTGYSQKTSMIRYIINVLLRGLFFSYGFVCKVANCVLEKSCLSDRLVRFFNEEKYVFRKGGYIQPVSMLKALPAALA